jgi:hypothetical protein
MVLVVHVETTMWRLANAQWQGQAMVAKAEAVQGQTRINQKVAGKCAIFYNVASTHLGTSVSTHSDTSLCG